MKYAGPDSNAKLCNADEVELQASGRPQKAERVHRGWCNQEKRRPQELGV